jgi:(+)-neomenthol dehydrogenase
MQTPPCMHAAMQGIGFEAARLLAEQGLKTVVTARSKERGMDAMEKLRAATGSSNLLFHELDIVDEASVQAFAKWARNEVGLVTILINNAGDWLQY